MKRKSKAFKRLAAICRKIVHMRNQNERMMAQQRKQTHLHQKTHHLVKPSNKMAFRNRIFKALRGLDA